MGYGVIGNTLVFGASFQGSSPCTPASFFLVKTKNCRYNKSMV